MIAARQFDDLTQFDVLHSEKGSFHENEMDMHRHAGARALRGAAAGWAGDLDGFKGETGAIKISGGTAHIPVMKAAAVVGARVKPVVL